MGELLFCNESIAALPFYVETLSINLYSLEEMCYYITNNTYLLEKDFMSEELCTWIEKELKTHKLAEKLRDHMRNQGKLSDFVLYILQYCGYCTQEEVQEILLILRQMEEKTDFECCKIRADRLMENEKYISSIYEYRRLLESEDIQEQNAVIVGNIWHNLGTAYTRMFLFEEAISCYQKAYALNQKQDSLKACLLAYRCMRDEVGFVRTAKENYIDEIGMNQIRNELSIASRNENTQAFEEQLEQIAQLNANGNKAEYQKAINDIIFQWKEEYRKNCRV